MEYTVRVDPQIPADQAYSVTAIKLSDTYSGVHHREQADPEITDLGTGGIIPKSAYKVQWDEANHSFEATFAKDWVAANWKAGSNPRVLLRFEAKVNEDAPTDKTVGNKAALTVNNGVTPSNKVENEPPVIKPSSGTRRRTRPSASTARPRCWATRCTTASTSTPPGSPTPPTRYGDWA